MIREALGVELGLARRDVAAPSATASSDPSLRPRGASARKPRRSRCPRARARRRTRRAALSSPSRSTRRPFCCRYSVSFEQLQVVREERRARVVFHVHQRVADEQLARGLRIDLLVGHAAARGQHADRTASCARRSPRATRGVPNAARSAAASPGARRPARSTRARRARRCARRPSSSRPARRSRSRPAAP